MYRGDNSAPRSTYSTPRKHPQDVSYLKRKSVSSSPARKGLLLSPPKLPRSNYNSPHVTPTKTFALDDLNAALTHYFSPKRKASKSPARRAAQKRLNFEDVENAASTDSENDENSPPPQPTDEVKCDLEKLTHCFAAIDKFLPEKYAKYEKDHESSFLYWKTLLKSGKFNLLLHGVGSKRRLLNRFAETLKEFYYVEFYCYQPGVNCRQIFECINDEFELDVTHRGLTLLEWATSLKEKIENVFYDSGLFLIIHNIDAICMREAQQQNALSILAESSHIRLIATVDHKNATLLWDLETRNRFNWLLVPVSTFRTHGDVLVTSCELKSLGLNVRQGGRQHNFASLDVFWQATTSNMRIILEQLAIHASSAVAKDKATDDSIEPLSLSKFCRILKSEFATTSEAVLRQQLGEFVDSSIIRMDKEGIILLNVDRNVLISFLETKKT